MVLKFSVRINKCIKINISGLPNMDSKDVEEIFKVVLTDDASQESQDPNNSNVLLMTNNNMSTIPQAQNGVMVQNQSHTPIMSPSRTSKFILYLFRHIINFCILFRPTNCYVSWKSSSSSITSCSYQYAFSHLSSNVTIPF